MSAKDLWRRFQARNRRILSEVAQLQVALAGEEELNPPLPILPKTRSKTLVVVAFWLLIVFIVVAGWSLLEAGR